MFEEYHRIIISEVINEVFLLDEDVNDDYDDDDDDVEDDIVSFMFFGS